MRGWPTRASDQRQLGRARIAEQVADAGVGQHREQGLSAGNEHGAGTFALRGTEGCADVPGCDGPRLNRLIVEEVGQPPRATQCTE